MCKSPLIIFVLILWAQLNPVSASADSVRIGVLAKRGTQQCFDQWSPTADYLSQKIPEHSFTIVPLGFDEIHETVKRKEVDFVLANSSFYVDLEVRSGAQRIATLKNLHSRGSWENNFASVIFCRSDRQDIHSLHDLKNKTFMAVDQRSLGGWHMSWRVLKEKGINPHKDFQELLFGGSHDAVVYAVRDGIVDAGTVRSDTVERMVLEGKIKMTDFKVINSHHDLTREFPFIHSTPHYPEWPMAKFPHTPDFLAEQVAVALIQMSADSAAAQAGHCAGWTIAQNYRPVHECLMALRLSPYENYGKITLGKMLKQYGFWLLGILILTLLIVYFFIRSANLKVKLEQSVSAKEERERARALLQTVLDSLPSGVIIIDSQSRQIREVNPAAAKMIGLRPEELVGKTCHQFLCMEANSLCPILDLHQNTYNSEHFLATKSSGQIPILKTVVPIMLEGKEHLLESFFDISERKQAEAERERLAMAIEQVQESVIITDTEGIIQFTNPAFEKYSGYSADEATGLNVRVLKSGQHDNAFYQRMWDTLLSGTTWAGRLTNKRKDGTIFTEDATISPVLDSSGVTVNYVAVKRDITEEIKREDQYRQVQKMDSIGRLAGGIAHDFNNMLGVILGYTDMALEDVPPTSSLHNDLNEIKAATERSADLTHQLLAFARKQEIMPQVLDLNHTLSGMLNMLRRLIGEDVQLKWSPETELWPVKIDPSQLDQILVNLCVNAKDAIDGVGKLIIETKNVTFDEAYRSRHTEVSIGQFVQLVVSDDGCGIAKETLKNIFEPFFTTKAPGQGTGLGLATVYGIVKQNNGFINVYSELNQGTTFRIYFPRSEDSTSTIIDQDKTILSLQGQETILLVEDEPSLLQLTRRMLEQQGYNILSAATPLQAIARAKESSTPIHLLLTDVVMPEMNGRDLEKSIRPHCPKVKVLFMSGYTSNVIAHHGILDEDVHFIAKPFVSTELTAMVRSVLDND